MKNLVVFAMTLLVGISAFASNLSGLSAKDREALIGGASVVYEMQFEPGSEVLYNRQVMESVVAISKNSRELTGQVTIFGRVFQYSVDNRGQLISGSVEIVN